MEINDIENKILEFWKESKTFEQSVEKPAGKKPKGDYIFYDGPPFITGLPHYGNLLPSVVKDCVPRFWTMKGFKVERVWGWDCHGLPAENKVEKELKLKNKKEIESLGVDKFVCACKNYVNDVSGQWGWYIDKIARWVDFENCYKTMDLKFMESVIWLFKELHKKGLIYEGYRTSLHCPRCATPLSKFEITMDAGSYQNVTEMSLIVKFKLKSKKFENAFILAWTTTPWTLPGNLALAINKKLDYVVVEFKKEKYILAKERVESVFKNEEFKILQTIKGKDLVGLEYSPLFDSGFKSEKFFKIYNGNFVSIEEGTGVVHIAPNFGEDDFELGKANGFEIMDLMDENGIYNEKVKDFSGLYFKDTNKKVIEKLGEKLFSKFNHTHTYPFCYRCSTPLIYRTQKAWYLDTDKIRESMLKTNKKINWVPEYFKEGRFQYNLENAPHWCLSRSRYWGSPIPVWKCEKCEEMRVLGSIEEIEKASGKKVKDLHRPSIDKHNIKCKKCNGVMKRVPEILDCWFESGAMPYAQWNYPFNRKEDFKKIFPADFIIEYTGQLRGWFYYLHVLSNAMFGSECFKNVMVTGVLAGSDGRKMSKSLGNYPDPKETLEKYGGDTLRMYFLSSPVIIGGDLNINEKDIQDSYRKNIILLDNIHNFYKLSANKNFKEIASSNELDKWILSRINNLKKEVTDDMEKYEVPSAGKKITGFIEDFSTWYIRLNRERLNAFDAEALSTTKYVLENLSKVIAPFMPYIAERIWQDISGNNFKAKSKSVHLESWPKVESKFIDEELESKMKLVREIISIGLKERDQNKIGLRWPLSKVVIYVKGRENLKEFEDIIKEQLNVKNVVFESPASKETELVVELDFKITSELEEEGYVRELCRQIQAFRKKLGLEKQNEISLSISVDKDFEKILEKNKDFIKERIGAKEIVFGNLIGKEFEFKIKNYESRVGIKVLC